MTDKFDDIDFEDINGGTDTVEDDDYYKEMVLVSDEEVKMTQEAIEWEDCITRLEKHCYKSWICIPHVKEVESGPPKLFLEIHEATKCDKDKFFEWLKIAWPPTKDMKHEASDYEKDTDRNTAINTVVGLHQIVQFPMDKQ